MTTETAVREIRLPENLTDSSDISAVPVPRVTAAGGFYLLAYIQTATAQEADHKQRETRNVWLFTAAIP